MKKTCTILFSAAALTAGAQQWTEIQSFIPSANTAVESSYPVGSKTNASALAELKEELDWVDYGGLVNVWKSNFSNTEGSHTLTPSDDASRILVATGMKNTTSMVSQHFAVFDFSEQAMQADAVRISFSVDFVSRGGSLGFVIETGDWEDGGELRRASAPAPADGFKTKMMFGLANLEDGKFLEASLSTGDSMMFDYGSNDWIYSTDSDGSLIVSFVLDAAYLQTLTSETFALLLEATPTEKDIYEYFSFGDFKVEILEIPEPGAFASLFGILAFAVVIFRRRK